MSTANIQQQYSKLKQFNFRVLISSPKENSATSGILVYLRRLNSGMTMDVLLNGLSISAKKELESLCYMMGKTMSIN